MAVAASYIVVDRQIGIEDLQLAESLDCVKGIKISRFCRDQGLRLEPRFFGAYAGKVGIVQDQTLKVHFIPRQDTGLVLRWNRVAGGQG